MRKCINTPEIKRCHAQGNRRALRRGESAGDRTDRLLALLGDLGEHDLALAGCQENVPHMRFMDSDLTRLAGMAEAMGDADAMLRAMGRGGGSFALVKYLPAMLLAAASPAASHHRCASISVRPSNGHRCWSAFHVGGWSVLHGHHSQLCVASCERQQAAELR